MGLLLPLLLAHLRDLRHPMSVDLWIDRVGKNAKIIVVRLLGGLDWWRYGVERLAAIARERGSVLAVLPGEDRDDPRLDAAYLASPPLVVAFALAGDVNRNILTDPIGHMRDGSPVRLADLWPSEADHHATTSFLLGLALSVLLTLTPRILVGSVGIFKLIARLIHRHAG